MRTYRLCAIFVGKCVSVVAAIVTNFHSVATQLCERLQMLGMRTIAYRYFFPSDNSRCTNLNENRGKNIFEFQKSMNFPQKIIYINRHGLNYSFFASLSSSWNLIYQLPYFYVLFNKFVIDFQSTVSQAQIFVNNRTLWVGKALSQTVFDISMWHFDSQKIFSFNRHLAFNSNRFSGCFTLKFIAKNLVWKEKKL